MRLEAAFLFYAPLLRTSISTAFIYQLNQHQHQHQVARRGTPLVAFALFGDRDVPSTVAMETLPKGLQWQVYVDQSKSSLDKGSSATLDALISLAPPRAVQVIPAILPKSKLKGPVVRCLSVQQPPSSTNGVGGSSNSNQQQQPLYLDVSNVDSVDKVYRLLTKHMKLKDISVKLCECLKWKYKGNGYLDAGKIPQAIECYDQALALPVPPAQEGLILLMRSRAYLQCANTSHQVALRDTVNGLLKSVPNLKQVQMSFVEASPNPALLHAVLGQVFQETQRQEHEFRQTQYHHGMYQSNLLKATRDALRSTELLPKYATCWRQAGDILSELWKLKESTQYYERAMELDPTLQTVLLPVIRRLRVRQELLDNARAYGWSEDTLRLALDVAG